MIDMSPLSASWYFSEEVATDENLKLFRNNLSYVGHRFMVPNINDFHVLAREDNAKTLFHRPEGYSLVSNICRHHDAIMLKNSGNTDKILCPAHKWSYATDGKLINATRFDETPCLNLENQLLREFHGLLFLNSKVSSISLHPDVIRRLDISNYRYCSTSSQTYPFNWKIFMEVYLDNYHIPVIHPGLSRMVDINQQRYHTYPEYSAQFVKIRSHFLNTISAHYKSYQDIITDYKAGRELDMEIMWLGMYPNLMIEHYPFALVISTVEPLGARDCINHVEYYVDGDILEKYPDFGSLFIRAYSETAVEDAEMCELIQQGRKYKYEHQIEQIGIHHPVLEKGLPEFYHFIRKNLASY